MSLTRRKHFIAPEIVQNAIILKSMEDVKRKTGDEPVLTLSSSEPGEIIKGSGTAMSSAVPSNPPIHEDEDDIV